MSSKSFFEEISREYMESNQDVFDLNNFENDYFRIIDNDYIKETLVSDLKYGGDIKDNFEKSNSPPNKVNNKLIAWVNTFNFSSNGNNLYSNCFPILILYHNNLKLIWKVVAQAVHFEKRVEECLRYKNLICLNMDHTLT